MPTSKANSEVQPLSLRRSLRLSQRQQLQHQVVPSKIPPYSKRGKFNNTPSPNLCNSCKKICRAFCEPIRRPYRTRICESHEELKNSACKCCHALSLIRPASFVGDRGYLEACDLQYDPPNAARNLRRGVKACPVLRCFTRVIRHSRSFYEQNYLAILERGKGDADSGSQRVPPKLVDYKTSA